jgi:catechol 2,3-dioxygenase-like lactoylglutathione lyase family enzyme
MNDPFSPNRKGWCMMDSSFPSNVKPRLPLKSFNHLSKEVINLEKSKNFYCDLLGFVVVPRPPFETDGYWLWGYNLSLHLVSTKNKRERRSVIKARYQHFTEALPRVDHFAFMTDDISYVKEILDQANVYYKHVKPDSTGIEQLFFFDPDGNVIEVSTCTANIGEIDWCHREIPETTTQPSTLAPISSLDCIQSVGINHLRDGDGNEDGDHSVRNFIEFEFKDGTREQVAYGQSTIQDKSKYFYDETDYSQRDSDHQDSSDIGSITSTPSVSQRQSRDGATFDSARLEAETSDEDGSSFHE